MGLLHAFRDAGAQLDVRARVLTADQSTTCAAAVAGDGHTTVPPCASAEFVPALLDLCEREQVDLLVPTIDTELTQLAAARDLFASRGVLVGVSSPDTVALAVDKRVTHAFLTSQGLPTVRQGELCDVLGDRRRWPFPFVVKPASGSGSAGVVFVRRDAQLAAVDGDVVVQSLARGREYTVDVFADADGGLQGAVPRERVETRGGEVVRARTRRVPALLDVADAVVRALPAPFGVLNVQVFLDDTDDDLRIIEINPRFGGGFPLSHRAGAPFARWLLELALHRPVTWADGDWQDDLLMLRYDEGLFVRPRARSLT